jgi:hypothetical protein
MSRHKLEEPEDVAAVCGRIHETGIATEERGGGLHHSERG